MKPVTNINYQQDGVVKVIFRDGSQVDADRVISTLPLGVMKKSHTTLFTPGLPNYIRNSIESLSFGTLNKIALEFDPPFWGRDFTGLYQIILRDLNDKNSDLKSF